MSPFAILMSPSASMSRTLVSSLSIPLFFIALLLVTVSPGIKAQYVTAVEIGSEIVDNDRIVGPRWRRVSFDPLISGAHAIRLSWDGNAEIRFSLFRTQNAQPLNDRLRIATSSGGANVQEWIGVLNQSEQYYLGVWAASGSANFTATIEAEIVTDSPIDMVTQPADLTITEGEDAVFSVTATGSDSLSFQWFADNVAIDGAVSDTLTIISPPLSVSGTAYMVVINDANGSFTSDTVTLAVNQAPVNVVIKQQPASLPVTEDEDAI